jgi:dCMP deaminase
MQKRKRITKDEYYMNIAREASLRSSCFRAQHGSVIIKDDQIISTGYTGAPRNTKDCFERNNCLRRELNIPSGQRYELCRSVHSEQNAIINSARAGVSLLGAKMYLYSVKLDEKGKAISINAYPCFICKKEIVNAGIEEVICHQAGGSMKSYKVKDWIKSWQTNDLIDDMEQYGVKTIKIKKGK